MTTVPLMAAGSESRSTGSRSPATSANLDAEHVDALAASIKLRGLLVPVIVRAGRRWTSS